MIDYYEVTLYHDGNKLVFAKPRHFQQMQDLFSEYNSRKLASDNSYYFPTSEEAVAFYSGVKEAVSLFPQINVLKSDSLN